MNIAKKHYITGSVVAVSGLALAFFGMFGFQYVSADNLIGETADAAFLLIFGGAILVVAAIIIIAFLLFQD